MTENELGIVPMPIDRKIRHVYGHACDACACSQYEIMLLRLTPSWDDSGQDSQASNGIAGLGDVHTAAHCSLI